jgi:hypothetical protein
MIEDSGEVGIITSEELCSLASRRPLAIAKLSRCLGWVRANLKLAAYKGGNLSLVKDPSLGLADSRNIDIAFTHVREYHSRVMFQLIPAQFSVGV